MGLNYLALAEHSSGDEKAKYLSVAHQLASSLFLLNFDATTGGFRSRSNSGHWDHSEAAYAQIKWNPEHFHPNEESRPAAHAMCIWFWSKLRDHSPEFDEQYREMTHRFLELYVREGLWRSGTQRTYSRSVDVAFGVLACLRMIQVHKLGDVPDRASLLLVVEEGREALLNRFGYGRPVKDWRSQVNLGDQPPSELSPRLVWQEVWVGLALLETSPDPANDAVLQEFFTAFSDFETKQGWMCNQPWRDGNTKGMTRAFLGDNALYLGLLGCGAQLQVAQAAEMRQRFSPVFDDFLSRLWIPDGADAGFLYNGFDPRNDKLDTFSHGIWSISETLLGLCSLRVGEFRQSSSSA